MDPASGEYSKLKNWIDTFMNIPFEYFSTLDVTKEDSHVFLEKSYSILNEAVYGLDDAKIQLIQLMGQLIWKGCFQTLLIAQLCVWSIRCGQSKI